jgi:integrase/recombinase XerD
MGPDERLFTVTAAGFYSNLRRYAERAGLGGITPHVLRHSAAKLRRDGGASLEQVSALLGHRNLATTSMYLARLEGDEDPGWRSAAALLDL